MFFQNMIRTLIVADYKGTLCGLGPVKECLSKMLRDTYTQEYKGALANTYPLEDKGAICRDTYTQEYKECTLCRRRRCVGIKKCNHKTKS